MHNCECGTGTDHGSRSNLFVDLNGFPYLLGEYLDRRRLQLVDRTVIKSGIHVDTSDAMRAVIDISIDDIGKRSDGTINIFGNKSKQKRLLDIISRNANRLDGQLPVLKSGIIVRVNYQLENERTRQVMRSMVEDLRITNRNYFLDVNRRELNDNAIVVNFNNSMVSTINEFTHGRDRMVIRITNIQLLYEMVTTREPIPRIKQSMTAHPYDCPNSHVVPGSNEEYFYHDDMQSRHFLGDPSCYDSESLIPPTWAMFNQFYHFDKLGNKIILHDQEIYDPMRKVNLIPCGKSIVNRSFFINPGHRLIFKISIWKNDVTAVFGTLDVAKALKAKFYNCCDNYHHNHPDDIISDDCHCHDHRPPEHHKHPHHDDKDYGKLISMLYAERKENEEKGVVINDLLSRIKLLEETLASSGVTPPPEDPKDPPNSDSDCECGCDHTEIHEKIEDLENRINDEDIGPMTPDQVQEIFDEIKNSKEGEI